MCNSGRNKSTMRILTVSHTAGSSRHGMLFRPFYLSREFIRRGHEASIVTASYFHTRLVNPHVERNLQEEMLDGVRFLWLKTLNYGRSETLRVMGMLRFAFSTAWYAKEIAARVRPDVVIATSPDPLIVFGACYIARVSKARLVFEFRDIWPLTLVELSGKPRWHPFILLLRAAEEFGLRKADLVVSVLANAEAYLREIDCMPKRLAVVPNGISPAEWEQKEFRGKCALRDKLESLRADGKFIICYAGHHGVATALAPLIEAMALLRDEPVALVLIGHGPDKPALQATVGELQLHNVHFFDTVSRGKIAQALRLSDAGYAGSQPADLYRFGLSFNKLFDYMMAGRPIVSAICAPNDPISQAGCGVKAQGEGGKEIAQAIRRLAALTPHERSALGERGRAFAMKEHDYALLAERYLEYLTNLLDPSHEESMQGADIRSALSTQSEPPLRAPN